MLCFVMATKLQFFTCQLLFRLFEYNILFGSSSSKLTMKEIVHAKTKIGLPLRIADCLSDCPLYCSSPLNYLISSKVKISQTSLFEYQLHKYFISSVCLCKMPKQALCVSDEKLKKRVRFFCDFELATRCRQSNIIISQYNNKKTLFIQSDFH